MPRRLGRLPGRLLGIVFGVLVLVHGALAARGLHELYWRPSEGQQSLVWLALSLGVALIGRLLLSFLPPGPTGAHGARGIAETWAVSLALGWLGLFVSALPQMRAWAWIAERKEGPNAWLQALQIAVPVGLLAGLALARWLTLPGAMVPRHEMERSSPRSAWLVLPVLLWLAFAACTQAFVAALAWLALGILLERALARARRAPEGRALFLLAFVLLGNPAAKHMAETYGLLDELGLAAALGCGAAYLVPWLRRADRRAGVLAGLFFAAPFLLGWDPLMLAGPLVLVAAAHPRQRRAGFAWSAAAAAVCFVCGTWSQGAHARDRLLLARELVDLALDTATWGLAWPLVALALAVGALTFPWRAAWQPGAIEEPRREALAVAGLLALVVLALACPASRFLEPAALVIAFPPCALLAGLLLIPPERATPA